jgi:phosphate transport system permease protein
LPTSIFDQAMALPYHLYVISTSGTDIENQERWLGTALVLIIVLTPTYWRMHFVSIMGKVK